MEAQLADIRDKTSIQLINQVKDSIVDCAKELKSNDSTFQIRTLPSMKDKLAKLMNDYVSNLKSIEADQKAFKTLSQKIEKEENEARANGGVYPEDPNFVSTFKKMVASEKKKLTQCGREAKAELNEVTQPCANVDVDEEIQVEEPALREVPKDPITKTDIRVAVKSKICNHVFDEEAIENYFLQKEAAGRDRIRCPLAGCTNKNMTRSELVLDEETNNLIQSL